VDWLTTLTDFPQFRDGFALGVVVALLVAGAGVAVRVARGARRRPAPWGFAGPGWVLAAAGALFGWWGYRGEVTPTDRLLLGLLVLGLLGELASHTPNPKVIGILLAVPGAVLVATARDFPAPGPAWTPWVVGVGIAVGGPLAADLDMRSGRLGMGPLLWLVTVTGVYATVPDTELVRALVGAAVPIALTGWPLRLARLGGGGACAGVGLLLWVAGFDGYGRPGSIVGAVAALGLFVAEPLGRSLSLRRWRPWSRELSVGWYQVALVAGHVIVVWYGARVAGFARTGAGALLLLVPAVPVALAIGALLRASTHLRPGHDHRRRRRRARGARPGAS
jgi:hypothetical protein